MGFDLKPRNSKAGWFHMGAFSWHWMLDAGVGLLFGYGPGYKPAQFVYKERPDGLCIGYTDGAKITATEAKTMAMVARWICDYQDTLNNLFMKEPEDERRRMSDDNFHTYRFPVRRDFVDLVRKFADWSEISGEFTIH